MSLSRQNLHKNISSHISSSDIFQSQNVVGQSFSDDMIANIYMTGSWCFIIIGICSNVDSRKLEAMTSCYMGSVVGHVTGHVMANANTPPWAANSRSSSTSWKVLYTRFWSLVKNHQNTKNLIENKKTASEKRVQWIISMSAQIVCSVDRKMQVLLMPA